MCSLQTIRIPKRWLGPYVQERARNLPLSISLSDSEGSGSGRGEDPSRLLEIRPTRQPPHRRRTALRRRRRRHGVPGYIDPHLRLPVGRGG
uniref:Uncharacterized protein n=1 Tax=Oryza brachyantha TaxID=4533 RepID=J3KZ75_ORYBR